MQHSGGVTAITEMLGLGATRAEEAVGVFESSAAADAAYQELISRGHRACIANAIESLSSAQSDLAGGSTEIPPDRPMPIGDQASGQRYSVPGSDPSTSGTTEVISIHTGRCVAALILVAQGREPEGFTGPILGRTAARLLDDHCR